MDLTQATHEWKVPAPRRSLATSEGILKAVPYKEVSADNIIANMENMHAARIFPGYAQWATVFGERFVDPLVHGQGTPEELASKPAVAGTDAARGSESVASGMSPGPLRSRGH